METELSVALIQASPLFILRWALFRLLTCSDTRLVVSLPQPQHSYPTQSMEQSTRRWSPFFSGGSRLAISAMMASESVDPELSLLRSIVWQPICSASLSRSGLLSEMNTHAAPINSADCAAHRPTGPAPATYTIDPTLTPAFTAASYAVGKMSERNARP